MTIFELEQQLDAATHRFYPTSSKWVIYFLLSDNEIVYIGKSSASNYLGRIRAHLRDKDFDCYHVLPVQMNQAETLNFETSLISAIRPCYNKKDCKPDVNAIVRGMRLFRESVSKPIEAGCPKWASRSLFYIHLAFATCYCLFLFHACVDVSVGAPDYSNPWIVPLALLSIIGLPLRVVIQNRYGTIFSKPFKIGHP